jgi:hypothetical protein
MTTDRIKEIQEKTAYPNSVSVQQALLQVWNECEQDMADKKYTEEDMRQVFEFGLMNNFNAIEINNDNFKYFINSLNKQD